MCSFSGCVRNVVARDLCSGHYQQLLAGTPLKTITKTLPEVARFWCKVDRTESEDDCWLWNRALNRDGYGTFRKHLGPMTGAHIFSYELENGPVPQGREIDHTCRTRNCVNPRHLQAVTHKQNMENLNTPHNNTSGYPGVSWNRNSNKWLVYISHHGKKVYGGGFDDFEAGKKRAIELKKSLYTNFEENE